MKNLILLAALAVVATGCSVKTDLNDMFPDFGSESVSTNDKTYVSECQVDGSGSYKLVGKFYGGVSLRQVTYLSSSKCVGNPDSMYVNEEMISYTDYKFAVEQDDLVISPNQGGGSIRLRDVEKHSFAEETGLANHYTGTAENASGVKRSINLYTQIIGKSAYSGFPALWLFINGSETQPQSNPWIWSGVKTSDQMAATLSNCAKPQTIKVMAGTFKTCLVEKADGAKVWYGNAPLFGVIKLVRPANTTTNTTLEMIAPSTDAISVELTAVNY